METYSMDLRERVVQAYDEKKGSQAQIAALFNVSLSWVKKLLRFRRTRGTIAPKPHGGGRVALFAGARLEALRQDLSERPDATLEELLERSEVDGSIMAVHRALGRLGCRRKKSRCTPQSKTARMSSNSARRGEKRPLR
jgi:transposase